MGFVAEEARAEIREYLAERPKPKGHYLQIQAGGSRLDVFLFAAEGTVPLPKTVRQTGAAPRVLCIKNWGHIGGEWTPFGNWQAHLGNAVRASRVTPELLVAARVTMIGLGPSRWERLEDWDDRAVVMWRKESTTMSTDQNSKDQPPPKRRRRPASPQEHQAGHEPRPKPTHLLLLAGEVEG